MLAPGASVCVIGGGTIGLLAAKQCLDHGLVPTVFEKTARVGGIWRQDPPGPKQHSPAYDSLYTNSSGAMMNISDFPIPLEIPSSKFPTRDEICQYYDSYCDANSLNGYIHFNTTVEAVSPGEVNADTGEVTKWIVVANTNGVSETRNFDAVFCCSGQFWQPMWPELPGLHDRFKGQVRHAHDYRNNQHTRGKHVLIIGIGNSALDISLEVALGRAESVTISCRSGTVIIPVSDHFGKPLDHVLDNRFYQQSLPKLLSNLWFLNLTRATNAVFNKAGLPPLPKNQGWQQFSNLKEHALYCKLLRMGRIQLKGPLAEMREHTAVFMSGEEIKVDEVIVCTGYSLNFPYIEEQLRETFLKREWTARGQNKQMMMQWLDLYKYCMHPQHRTLCVFGIILTLGNESIVGEMQTRWALAMLTGNSTKAMPSHAEMDASVAKRKGRIKGGLPKFAQFVQYGRYMDDLAADIGCMPELGFSTLVRDPHLWWKLWFGPQVAAQYRLNGRHQWEKAVDFLKSLPTTANGLFVAPLGSKMMSGTETSPNHTKSNDYDYGNNMVHVRSRL